MLHIADGESVAGTLRNAAIPGTISIYGDLMYEGPAPAGLDAEPWRETRAGFIAKAGYATLAQARQYLKACDDALAAFPAHEEVVIWLDHRLSDQLILIKVLDWFNRQNRGPVMLSLVCVDRYPGLDDFAGLGQLTPGQLTMLANTRERVTDGQLLLAQAAWNAFTSPDPSAIERFLATDTSQLPFLGAAFRRHLEEFPSVDGGLSRTEREGLSILRDRGSVPGRSLFTAVQGVEEQVFMGDSSFYRIMADLSSARQPLCHVSDTPSTGLGEVTITEAGRRVIEGRADHVDLNRIDRWLGGVHLQGDRAAWRLDPRSGRLVRHRS